MPARKKKLAAKKVSKKKASKTPKNEFMSLESLRKICSSGILVRTKKGVDRRFNGVYDESSKKRIETLVGKDNIDFYWNDKI